MSVFVLCCSSAFVAGCSSDECVAICASPSPAFGFRVPDGTRSVSVAGDQCPETIELECGGRSDRFIDDPDDRDCSLLSNGYSGAPGTCDLSVTFEDGMMLTTSFSWTLVRGECCDYSEVEFDEGRAQLEEAGVKF